MNNYEKQDFCCPYHSYKLFGRFTLLLINMAVEKETPKDFHRLRRAFCQLHAQSTPPYIGHGRRMVSASFPSCFGVGGRSRYNFLASTVGGPPTL